MRDNHKLTITAFTSKLIKKNLIKITDSNFICMSISGLNLINKIKYFSKAKLSIKKKKYKEKTNLLINLTKKQKQRIKLNKLNKLIRPSSPVFFKFKKYPRNILINKFMYNSKGLIHDGYSWNLHFFNIDMLNFKVGSLCFKTRCLSPIDISSKGKMGLKMAQKNTFKIKILKVKRKK